MHDEKLKWQENNLFLGKKWNTTFEEYNLDDPVLIKHNAGKAKKIKWLKSVLQMVAALNTVHPY